MGERIECIGQMTKRESNAKHVEGCCTMHNPFTAILPGRPSLVRGGLTGKTRTTASDLALTAQSFAFMHLPFAALSPLLLSLVHGLSKMTRLPLSEARSRVCIIGGGIAGLACAERLSAGCDVTVFDTGRLRPGGRCSTRQAQDIPKELEEPSPSITPPSLLSNFRFDHAAQIIATPNLSKSLVDLEAFAKKLDQWKSDGVLSKFPKSSIFKIESYNEILPINEDFYFGTDGMGSIPESIVRKSGGAFDLRQDVWVSPSNGVKYQLRDKKWIVQNRGQTLGIYDTLIIAHNGKCADRLMSKTPAKHIHSLLRVNFSPTVPAHGGKRMTLNSIYSLTVALPPNNFLSTSLPPTFIAGFVHNHPAIRFLTCQTRKYPHLTNTSENSAEVWTILSSGSFAKRHKAPQEFLTDETVNKVTSLLLKAVQEAVAGQDTKNCPELCPLDRRLQLWGAALPLNIWGEDGKPAGFLYDSEYNVGVCGDWLVEPSIAGAWTSGKMLADHMISSTSQCSSTPLRSHGLSEREAFFKSESAAKLGIAAMPTMPK